MAHVYIHHIIITIYFFFLYIFHSFWQAGYHRSIASTTVSSVCNRANRAKNKHRCCNSFMWFIFNLQRWKICAVLYNNIQQIVFTRGVLKCEKSLTWGGGRQCKSVPLDHCWKSTAPFPTSHWPHSLLKPSHFQSHTGDTTLQKERGLLHGIHLCFVQNKYLIFSLIFNIPFSCQHIP